MKTYRLISFLGIHVVYDLSRNPGERVVKLEVLCTQCRVPSYEPLRMDEVYKVILPNFLAKGGDGFRMIKDEVLKHDSGKHKCLHPSLAQRYRRTELVPRGELRIMLGGQSQKSRCIPTLPTTSCFVCWETAARPGGILPCLSPAHVPIHPSPGKNIFT